ncbi:six-hairpin glycosidase [Thozetella sp. PMI_491]|nr:six-hairpin glycosidase [Thozetella sp. PMI_491]
MVLKLHSASVLLLAGAANLVAAALDADALLKERYGNDSAWYLSRIPIFDSSDAAINDVYYYRWNIFRAHQRDLGALGYISTEFLDDVSWQLFPWASLNDATGFHLGEGRWSRDRRFTHDYIDFLYTTHNGVFGNDRHFSEAIADASWRVYLVDGDASGVTQHLTAMKSIYNAWSDRYDSSKGLYWVEPLYDATEYTISSIDATGGTDGFTGGNAFRPSINSFQYANARAIANIATLAGDSSTAADYNGRAARLRANFTASLWNDTLGHFIDRYQVTNQYVTYWNPIRGRELVGLLPWMFDVPEDQPKYARAWLHAFNTSELRGPFGLRTVEPSYQYYMRQYRYDSATGNRECQWNGPVWPFQTTQALHGLANLLDHYESAAGVVDQGDYLELLRLYTQLHYGPDGVLNLQEDYDPATGRAIVGLARSPHYFHSGFVDNVLTGLVGIRPRADNYLEVNPLASGLAWFRVENVPYHGHSVNVQWDADGSHYGKAGLLVEIDGVQANSSTTLKRLVTPIGRSTPSAINRVIAKSVQLQSSSAYPVGTVSVAGADVERIHDAIDGRVWFWTELVNGYDSAVGDGSASQWYSIDFGNATAISGAELAFHAGSVGGQFAVPLGYSIEYLGSDSTWRALPGATLDEPIANGITHASWPSISARNVRLSFVPRANTQVRLVEFKVY